MTAFEKRCEATEYFSMFCEVADKNEAVEDDGTLHISKKGSRRACFDVGNGQSLSGKDQNARTREVMDALKIKVNDSCLVDEDDEDEDGDACPHCGYRRDL